MKFTRTKFKNLIIVSHNLIFDQRGYFKETFRNNLLDYEIGYKFDFCQENNVFSKLNVLRGLHFQVEPFAQSKYITVLEGKILDIAVDIRINSDTYGKYFSYELSSDKHESIFIPRGFAHGYLTLTSNAVVNYKVDNYYNPNSESGILFSDKFLNIDWGIDLNKIIISKKDINFKPYDWK